MGISLLRDGKSGSDYLVLVGESDVSRPDGYSDRAAGALGQRRAASSGHEPLRVFTPNTIKIMTWRGLRGGISVALALSLPQFPGREMIVAATYVVVIFSILVQALTMGHLVRRLSHESVLVRSGRES